MVEALWHWTSYPTSTCTTSILYSTSISVTIFLAVNKSWSLSSCSLPQHTHYPPWTLTEKQIMIFSNLHAQTQGIMFLTWMTMTYRLCIYIYITKFLWGKVKDIKKLHINFSNRLYENQKFPQYPIHFKCLAITFFFLTQNFAGT